MKRQQGSAVYPIVDIVQKLPPSRAERCYRALLRLFPTAFREAAEPELVAWFRAGWRDAGLSRSRLGFSAVLCLDLLRALPAEWLAHQTRPRTSRSQGASTMETLWQDMRYAVRTLRTAPLVTLVAALTIAIGIGATTTIFSVANALLLRTPAGIRESKGLVTVHRVGEDGSSFHAFSFLDIRALNDAPSGMEGIAGYTMFPASIRTGETPKLEAGMLTSANYFSLLRTRPLIGRFYTEAEEGQGAPPIAVLSEPYWRRQFNADPAVLGRTVTVNGQPLTVIGVAEAGFRGQFAAMDISLWAPLGVDPLVNHRDLFTGGFQSIWLEAFGRLNPGATRKQAVDGLNPVFAGIGRTNGLDRDQSVDLRAYFPIPAPAALPVGGFLGLLVILAGMVLLIASANVGNILLARAAGRAREIAVRLALGARRIRVVRQLLTESLILFVAGGVMGTFFAFAATRLLARLEPPVPVPLALDFHLDLLVLAIALIVTLAAGVVFGLAPALHGTRADLSQVLRDGARTGRGGKARLRAVLVAGQVGATAFLLVVAALFARALSQAASIDTGFDGKDVYVLQLMTQVRGYDEARFTALATALETEAAAMPGVVAVGTTDVIPLAGSTQETQVGLPGKPAERNVGIFQSDFTTVSPGYFAAMGMNVTAGRIFEETDRRGAPAVVIINETLARQLWPGESAVGKILNFGSFDGDPSTVVGVVPDAMYRQLGEEPVPMTYAPRAQQGQRDLTLLVRMAPGAPPPLRQLHASLKTLDPELPISGEGALAGFTSMALLPGKIAFMIGTAAGATGLLLAVVGLYGLLAYRVQLRRKEIGIRVALGAANRDVRRLVVGEGIKVTVGGLLFGLVLAGVVGTLLRSFLYGVGAMDPLAFGGIAVLLLAVAWLASLGPVRRALRTEPLEVLRHD